MRCRLCGTRKARRACPALGTTICTVCCGSKRLQEIPCPPTCAYLATAREHPAAVTKRQQQLDIASLAHLVRDFNERQSQLFLIVATFLARYQTPDFQPLLDEDVTEVAAALAGTFETASRGVIYEHRPTSRPAERLAQAIKPVLAEAGKGQGTSFERDTAVVFRRIEKVVTELRESDPGGRRAFLNLVGRVVSADVPASAQEEASGSRLIVP